MSEEKKPFTVKDRRHFAADGELRDDAAAAGPAAPPSAEPAAVGPGAPTGGVPPAEDEAEQPTLVGFFAGLAAQAGMLLGGGLPAEGEEPAGPDLLGARHLISVLEMLEEKTRGNRSADEDRAIESLLYQLRMGYVEVARRAVS
jgi:hypothetical protein